MWVGPHVDPILCYHFFGWIQIFGRYKFVPSGKYMGVTLAEIWNLQENFDYLPHVSWLNFCFKKSTFTDLLYMFRPFFLRLSYVFWLAQKKISRKQKTNQGHRLQSLGAFPDHPMYPAVVSKFDTGWSYSGRTQGTQGYNEREYNMSCVCKVGWMLKIRWMVGLGGWRWWWSQDLQQIEMEGLGIEKLSMPFIANLFSSDSAEPCCFFFPLVIQCVTDPMLGKRLQQEIADNCLNWFKKNDSPAVKKNGPVGPSGWACRLVFTKCFVFH